MWPMEHSFRSPPLRSQMWEDRLLPLKQTVRHLSIPVHHRGSFPLPSL